MKVHVFVSGKPAVVLRLIGVEVLEDHMDFLVGILRNELVHEMQKLPTPSPFVVSGLYLTGCHIENGRQGGGFVPLVSMT